MTNKITLKSYPKLHFHPLITGFYFFAYLWLSIEEKIHLKAIADVSRDVLVVFCPGSKLILWGKGLSEVVGEGRRRYE